jgi:hypothetical protein
VVCGAGLAGDASMLASSAPCGPTTGGLADGALVSSSNAPGTLAGGARHEMAATRVVGADTVTTMVSTADGHTIIVTRVGGNVVDLK